MQIMLHNWLLYQKRLDHVGVLRQALESKFLNMAGEFLTHAKFAIRPGDCPEQLVTHSEGSSLSLTLLTHLFRDIQVQWNTLNPRPS